MAILGNGQGTGYPGTIDTYTVEQDGVTRERAAVPNDTNAAVTSIQAELGTNPKGTKADVKTFLQVEHGTDGTHPNMGGLAMKVINIGDWNMDSTQEVDIAHGLTKAKIRTVQISIRKDSALGSDLWPIDTVAGTTTVAGYFYVTDSNIILVRTTSGFFDTTSFDETSYNRGWITIWYVP